MTVRDSGWEADQAIDERPACPECGATGPNEIHYGLIAASHGGEEARQRLGIVFPGCTDEGMTWQCRACSYEWGSKDQSSIS